MEQGGDRPDAGGEQFVDETVVEVRSAGEFTLGQETEKRYASTPSPDRSATSCGYRWQWSQATAAVEPSLTRPGSAVKASQTDGSRASAAPSIWWAEVDTPQRKSAGNGGIGWAAARGSFAMGGIILTAG